MELNELEHEEKLACVALIKGIVLDDNHVSRGEAVHARELGRAFGESGFRELMREATAKVTSEDDLKGLLGTIQRQEARNLIFGLAMETAFEDGLQGHESTLLDWLVAEWSITIDTEA